MRFACLLCACTNVVSPPCVSRGTAATAAVLIGGEKFEFVPVRKPSLLCDLSSSKVARAK